MELFIRIPHIRQSRQSGVVAIVRGDLKESFGFIFQEKPILRRAMLMVFPFNLTFSCLMMVGLPVIITQTLGVSSELYGITQGLMAAGGLIGGALAGVLAKRMDMRRMYKLLMRCTLCLLPIALCLLMGAPSFITYIVITAMSFACMALATLFTVQILSFVQIVSPASIVGTVLSTLMAVSMSAQPIGQAIYGLLFERISGGEWAIVLASAAISLVIALFSKVTFQGFSRPSTGGVIIPEIS